MHLNPSAHTIERSIAFILASHRSLRFYGCFKAEIKILFYIQKPDVSQTAILFPTTVVIFSLRCCIWPTVLCLSFSRDVQAYSRSLFPSPQRSARRLGAEVSGGSRQAHAAGLCPYTYQAEQGAPRAGAAPWLAPWAPQCHCPMSGLQEFTVQKDWA